MRPSIFLKTYTVYNKGLLFTLAKFLFLIPFEPPLAKIIATKLFLFLNFLIY